MSVIPGFLEISEVAKRCDVHYSQAARYVQHGDLPHISVGRSKLVPESALIGFTPNPVGNPNFTKKKRGRKKSA